MTRKEALRKLARYLFDEVNCYGNTAILAKNILKFIEDDLGMEPPLNVDEEAMFKAGSSVMSPILSNKWEENHD